MPRPKEISEPGETELVSKREYAALVARALLALPRLLAEQKLPPKLQRPFQTLPDMRQVLLKEEAAVRAIYEALKENKINLVGLEHFPGLVEHLQDGGKLFFLGPHWSVVDIMAFELALEQLRATSSRQLGDAEQQTDMEQQASSEQREAINFYVPTSSKFYDARLGALGALLNLFDISPLPVVQPGDKDFTGKEKEANDRNMQTYRQIMAALKNPGQAVGFFPQATRNIGQATTKKAHEETMAIIRSKWRDEKTLVVPFAVHGAWEVAGKGKIPDLRHHLTIHYCAPITYPRLEQLAAELKVGQAEVPVIIGLATMPRQYWGIYEGVVERYLQLQQLQ